MAGATPQGCQSPWTLLAKGRKAMRIVCISDTHGGGCALSSSVIQVPHGDVLVHAGDLTGRGRLDQVQREMQWLASLPHRHKIFVAGNHDFFFEKTPEMIPAVVPPGITYLQDAGVVIDGISFWGSPWQPEFCGWAFNLPRGEELAKKWAMIPENIDVLITHGPPRKKLDYVLGGSHVGCSDLARRVAVVRPLLHVFGHVHEGHGTLVEDGITYVNAAICDRENYDPRQGAIVVDVWHDEQGQRQLRVIQGE